MTWGLSQIAMFAAGGLLGLCGLWLLLAGGKGFLSRGLRLADSPPAVRLSEPTRVTVGFLALLWGYHLIVWAMPTYWTSVQFNRSLWYVWLGASLALIGFSILQDRREKGAGE